MCIEKLRELLETPNVKTRAISSQASQEEGSTTILETGVGASAPKRAAPFKGDDMVSPAMKVAAVLKDGWRVTISSEDRCGEGGHIPIQNFSLGQATINRYKLASIVPLTMELAEMSTPAAEAVFRSAMEEAYARMLDTALLSSGAAVAGVRPAGLLVGAATAAGDTTGGYASTVADIRGMLGTFAANGMGARPVLILNDQDFMGVGLQVNPLGQMMFAGDVSANQLLGIPVLHSRNVTQGTAIMVDAEAFVSAFDGPRFRISQEATLTMADAGAVAPTQAGTDATPGAVKTAGEVPPDSGIKVSGNTGNSTTGYTALNMFQTYSEAIRGVWPTSWSLVRTNAVVTRTALKW